MYPPHSRYTYLLTLCVALLPTLLIGQIRFSEENADCTGAITIQDSIYGPTAMIRGFGNVLEIKNKPKDDPKYFEREHNSVWFKFTTPWACDLSLDIIPEDPSDDIDFLLFQASDETICEQIVSGEAAPVRSNISRSDESIGSRTGLDLESFEPYVRSGLGSAYSMSVASEQDQLYYMVLDYPERPNAGFNIHLHFGPRPIKEPTVTSTLKRQQVVHVRLFDVDTKKPIDGAVAIEGMVHDSVVTGEGMSDYTFTMDHYRKLRVSCAKKGYMLHQQKVKGTNDPVVKVDLQLKPITPGQNVVLDDITFMGNRAVVKESSETALQQLLAFMQDNPDVTIEVQGHVNGPKMKNKKEFIQLSTERAKAVRDFLLVNDIDAKRVQYKGYGNSKMIYPEARTRTQSEANRRVEIAVIDN